MSILLPGLSVEPPSPTLVGLKQTMVHKVNDVILRRCDPKASQKSYWSILKTFLNNKKIPRIPSLIHQDKFVTDFKEKANIFNNFFANQYSIVSNNSELPVTLTRKTHESLSTIDFSTDDILKIIRNLDPDKSHGHDMISIRMIKICDTSICRPQMV